MKEKNELDVDLVDGMEMIPVRETWTNVPAMLQDEFEFQSWFQLGKSVKDILCHGFNDFFYKIFTQIEQQNFGESSSTKTCLEIGYGAGRLLLPASRVFEKVYGIDIHTEKNRVNNFLNANGVSNVELFHRNELNNIQSNSVDFVFSFIVFQHFDSWKEAEYYLQEIYRVMTDTGIAKIYFAINDTTLLPNENDVDTVTTYSVAGIEGGEFNFGGKYEKQGYSLRIKPAYMLNRLRLMNFNVLSMKRVIKTVWLPGDQENFSSQYCVTFQKNHD